MATQLQFPFCVFELHGWNVQYKSICDTFHRIRAHIYSSISSLDVVVWHSSALILCQHWTISWVWNYRHVENFSHFSGTLKNIVCFTHISRKIIWLFYSDYNSFCKSHLLCIFRALALH